jgi:thioredoxin-dependent peroxiredoxin
MNFFSMRHSFIVDPDGILRETYIKVRPSIHSEEILARLDELQEAVSFQREVA